MLPPPPLASARPRRIGRWLLVGSLILTLFLLGFDDEPVFRFLTGLWLKGLSALGLRQQAEVLQQGISGGITKRLLPAVATYAALYLSLCLLLLRLLLPTPMHWHLALRLYAGTLAMYVVITLLGRLMGNAPWAYRLSRQILDFIISPLPVSGLFVLLQVGFGTRSSTNPPA